MSKSERAAGEEEESPDGATAGRAGSGFVGPAPTPAGESIPAPAVGLRPVDSADDVLPAYRGSPIERFLAVQNQGTPFPPTERPVLIVATCVDPRILLRLPALVAFIIRSAGVNLTEQTLFQLTFMYSVVGIRHLALVGHEDCAMVNLERWRERFVQGLAEGARIEPAEAEAYFDEHREHWSLDDEVTSLRSQAARLRARFPGLCVAPLLYRLDGRIEQVLE